MLKDVLCFKLLLFRNILYCTISHLCKKTGLVMLSNYNNFSSFQPPLTLKCYSWIQGRERVRERGL